MSNFVNLLDVVYPVGSIYLSMNSASPSSIIGGTWKQINGALLMPSNTSLTYLGSNTHKHSEKFFFPEYYGWGNITANSSGGLHPLAGIGYNNSSDDWEVRSFTRFGSGANYFNESVMRNNVCTVNNCDVYTQEGMTASAPNVPYSITCYCWYRQA